jgi:hypothetical protein
VRHRRFRTKGIIGPDTNPRSELVLHGRLGRRGHAHGTMRVFGSAVPVDDHMHGDTDRCDSGSVDWHAHRR